MRIALVHDFLTQLGGAERVLECFHELYPKATVYTLIYDDKKTESRYREWNIKTSFLQNIPGAVKHYKWVLALMPKAIERFDFREYDVVLSDSSAFAKGVFVPEGVKHISYLHTPTRYLWEEMDEYVSSLPYSRFIKSLVKPYLKYYLKSWDYAAAQRPDRLIANSETVRSRIKQHYDRMSEVLYPPVDTKLFQPRVDKAEYFLTASRLEPYKKIELAINAFKRLNLPLKVIGSGTQLRKLKDKYSQLSNIDFLGRLTDQELAGVMANARAFVFPALEDAGIMVLEALSAGTPVVGFAEGGTAEFVTDGKNGILFEAQTESSLISAITRFKKMEFDPQRLRKTALSYDKEQFKEQIRKIINS